MLEPDVELTELVRARLPLPRSHRIRVRPVDGRAGSRPRWPTASADLMILDAYADGRVPAALTTVEFFAEVARVLRPDGLLLANLVDEPGFAYLRRVLAGLARRRCRELVLVSSTDVLRGRRFGNVVVAAGRRAADDRRTAPPDRPPAVPGRGPRPARRWPACTARPGRGRTPSPSESPEPVRGWRVR